ncbi:toll/interleukin-1 receptor domain-containing protein [Leptolyngbya sp. NIES-2104]|uniref:toll/interleukin-1 receptor domain-containing protein n=1 Tax=Leptolyngbya sp. NIES-2104 TaxID=1552121 RepID=UPI0006EC6D20|nr:toll/interleukin-1 receptor domain-containing protein [Leptolyngbya sp. NIES-2104]GAP99629.1 chaperone protein DnaK [Leptolyngbya sp. NIES-2104]
MSETSKYNFPNAQKVQIFEQVGTYIENNHSPTSENKTATSFQNSPLTLFYSYSHKDEILRDQLNTHLTLLQRQGIIDSWYDRNITAGTEWAEAIYTHLNTADIILLLISADFLASDYCYEKEMNRAIERHNRQEALIIPIILRPCDWTSAPFGKLQALPIAHGEGAKAVTTWSNQDEAFSAIATGIRKAATEIRPKRASS